MFAQAPWASSSLSRFQGLFWIPGTQNDHEAPWLLSCILLAAVALAVVFTKNLGDEITGLSRQWGGVVVGLRLELSLDNCGCKMGIPSELFEAIEAGEVSVKILDVC